MSGPLGGAAITGIGTHRPATVVDNAAVAARIGSTDEWIRERSGIISRRVAGPDETVTEMGLAAAGKALAAAGVDPAAVGLVLLATCSLPAPVPAAAPELAHRLGCRTAGATDLSAGCAGFCYALGLAADTVRAGSAEHVLVIGAERMSDIVDPTDRGTAFLFGDGAGAVLVSAGAADAIGPVVWQQDGALAGSLTMSPERQLVMEGRAVYRWATTALPDLARRACAAAGVEPAELAGFVPHQANLRITEALVRALRLPPEVAVARDITEAGNTSAASIPLALARLLELGEVRRGGPVLLLGFGAGLTAAGQVVRVP